MRSRFAGEVKGGGAYAAPGLVILVRVVSRADNDMLMVQDARRDCDVWRGARRGKLRRRFCPAPARWTDFCLTEKSDGGE